MLESVELSLDRIALLGSEHIREDILDWLWARGHTDYLRNLPLNNPLTPIPPESARGSFTWTAPIRPAATDVVIKLFLVNNKINPKFVIFFSNKIKKMASADTSDDEDFQGFDFIDILAAGQRHMRAQDDLQVFKGFTAASADDGPAVGAVVISTDSDTNSDINLASDQDDFDDDFDFSISDNVMNWHSNTADVVPNISNKFTGPSPVPFYAFEHESWFHWGERSWCWWAVSWTDDLGFQKTTLFDGTCFTISSSARQNGEYNLLGKQWHMP